MLCEDFSSGLMNDNKETFYLVGPIFKSTNPLNNTLVLDCSRNSISIRLFTSHTKGSTKHFGYSAT